MDKIHPAQYPAALTLVEEASAKIKEFAAEPWTSDVARLERRVAELEKGLAAKNIEKLLNQVTKLQSIVGDMQSTTTTYDVGEDNVKVNLTNWAPTKPVVAKQKVG